MTQVELPWMPILCSIEPQDTPLRAPTEPSSPTRNFGTTKSELPFVPIGAPSMRASTRCTMFSARSCSPAEMKILVPEIGAAMRLGQVHGPGPGTFDHLRQKGLFLLIRAMHVEGGDRPLR